MSATERREKLRDLHQKLGQVKTQLFGMVCLNAELVEQVQCLTMDIDRLRCLLQDTTCAICGRQMLDHDEPCEEPC